jgi:2-haloacid dehalogenase
LRDGFALTAAGAYADFRTIAADVLTAQLTAAGIEPTEDTVGRVLTGMTQLSLHPDVEPGLRRLHEAGLRIITLTNGSAAMSERMFTDGGIMPLLEHRLDVGTPQRWKPHPDAYRYAADVCGVPVDQMALVAVHPWDIDGARRAGMQGYYLDRRRTPYPKAFLGPDVVAADLVGLADALQAKAK